MSPDARERKRENRSAEGTTRVSKEGHIFVEEVERQPGKAKREAAAAEIKMENKTENDKKAALQAAEAATL